MVRSPARSLRRSLVTGCSAALALLHLACGGHDSGGERPPLQQPGLGGAPPVGDGDGDCAEPSEGCPCETPGESVECGSIYRTSDGYVACTIGFIECMDDSTYGPCVGDTISLNPIPDTGAN